MLNFEVFLTYEQLGERYKWAPFDNDYLEETFRDWIKEIAPSGWNWSNKRGGIVFRFANDNEAMRFKISC